MSSSTKSAGTMSAGTMPVGGIRPYDGEHSAQLVVRNARVHTGDPARPAASAVAITDGVFTAAGDIENHLVGSWAEHLARHRNRLIATDRSFEDRARALLPPGTAPEVTHAFDAAVGPVPPTSEKAAS
ncbi:hypothetical protein [Streptomyces sp. NBC_01261]|uniref:hypothetical protein n=1 Tax=Streptomyces sp. NBC_01261 TaxID=2903802 RepID=UPI003FCE7702